MSNYRLIRITGLLDKRCHSVIVNCQVKGTNQRLKTNEIENGKEQTREFDWFFLLDI